MVDFVICVNNYYAAATNSTTLAIPPASYWPQDNSQWGVNTLYPSLDSAMSYHPGQDGELNLTGTASFVGGSIYATVYYDGMGYQNPGTQAPEPPNWFYYYKDNAGGGVYTYKTGVSGSDAGWGMSFVCIGDDAYAGTHSITYDYSNPGGRLKATGWSGLNTSYANFLALLAHESQHACNETKQPYTDGDTDGDYLRSAFETGTSKTNPDVINSAHGVLADTFNDDEVYAGGPVEKAAIDGADTSGDWANPGTNW